MIFFLAGRNPRVIRTGVYADIDHKIRKYIGTKLAISAATGILVWASLKSIREKLLEMKDVPILVSG